MQLSQHRCYGATAATTTPMQSHFGFAPDTLRRADLFRQGEVADRLPFQ